MKKQQIAGVLLALLLGGGCLAALAAGGTSSDPLVSLRYLEGTYLPNVTAQLQARAEEKTQKTADAAQARLDKEAEAFLNEAGGGIAAGKRKLTRNETATVYTGSSLTLLSGTVQVAHDGTVVDVTEGKTVESGGTLVANHRYLAAENTKAVFTVYSETASVSLQGNVHVSQREQTMPFTDVAETDWFYDSVRFVYENGLFQGMTGTLFMPQESMNRAMLATVLYRLAGGPEAVPSHAFQDVPAEAYYAEAVSWAYQNGIVEGMAEGIYAPDQKVTREQMAVMLYRYAKQYAGMATEARGDLSAFPDQGKIAPWAREAMAWAVGEGIMEGANGQLLPGGSAKRAEVAAMLQRFSALVSA